MCGIAGLVGYPAPVEHTRDLVSAMAVRMAHRGPDGGGVSAHPDATIGMVRLAIVDVVSGHQPMANDDESIVLVYNGEVYNAPALRKELQGRGVRFRTHSDTEVILRLYEQDPEHVEEHLVGMWAFAIHDRRRRRFVISRDRFGIKPLFIADTGTALAFASDLRCFDRTLPAFSPLFAIDHAAAHAMMSWSYIPETSTMYQGVHRLAPATRLTIDLATKTRSTRTYWSLQPSADAARVTSMDEACERVDALLARSVREHLESDVPVATFLSGGIDSSLITAYACDAASRPIEAFSIGFDEPRYDESPAAREIAAAIGVPLHVETFDESRAREEMVNALLAYDEPFGDSSSLATYLLSGRVGRSFKVALGGDGGDEVFAGYTKYMVFQVRQPLEHFPLVRNAAGQLLAWTSRLPGGQTSSASTWSELLRRAGMLSRGLVGTDAAVYAHLTQWASLARTAPLMRQPQPVRRFELEAQARFEQATGTPLQRMLAADMGSMLCNQMLTKVDRASMACSLEARVPFLDHRVVEYGVGLPEPFTIGPRGGAFLGKRVLRTLYERRFGVELARRKKRGFSVPVRTWLEGPFSQSCDRLFAKQRLDRYGILSSEALSNDRHREWLAGADPRVAWHAFALAAWCEATLGDGPDALRDLIEPRPERRVVFQSGVEIGAGSTR